MRCYCALDLMEGSGSAPAHSRQSKTHENLQSRPRNHPGGGQCRRYPRKGRPGMLARPCLRRHPPIPRTERISPGEGLGEGTPSPAKRTTLALPQGSRAGAGVLVARARAGRNQGCQSQTYVSPASRYTLFCYLPHPAPAACISPERPARDAGPTMSPPASSHTPDRGDITRGGARGGNPLPGKENHTGPSHRAPAQEREFSWREPGRGATMGASPKHTFRRHLAMHRSPLPHPAPAACISPERPAPITFSLSASS